MFAPSPLLTVTIEPGATRPEVHLHPGGQGYWAARLAATLGADVVLCCALGGEPGRVLRGLIDEDPLTLRAADAGTPNGVYVHDRRSGTRVEVVSVESRPLGRHAADELYGIALGAGLDADVTMVTGCQPDDVIDAELYRRLVGDLRANGKCVIADLTGPPLRATLEGGVELLKLSEVELINEGYSATDASAEVIAGARRLHAQGAGHVLVSRGSAPALLIGGMLSAPVELVPPAFESLDERGAGDSMFAATGVGLAPGDGHDRRTAAGHGGRRAQRHPPRSGHRHTRRDRTAGRPRRCAVMTPDRSGSYSGVSSASSSARPGSSSAAWIAQSVGPPDSSTAWISIGVSFAPHSSQRSPAVSMLCSSRLMVAECRPTSR